MKNTFALEEGKHWLSLNVLPCRQPRIAREVQAVNEDAKQGYLRWIRLLDAHGGGKM